MKKFESVLRSSLVILLFFLLWDSLSRFGAVDRFILPTVTDVLHVFGQNISNGKLFGHIAVSLKRTGTGFILAVSIGVVLGVIMGWFKKTEQFLDPILQLFRNTSVLAMFPVFILAFGLGERSKVAIVFWGSIWPALLNTINGVKSIDPLLIKSARSMGISTLGLFRKVVLPAALPEILTGIRLSAGTATIILVAAEMIGANKGLGFLIFYAQQKYDIPTMYMGILTISIIGILINYGLIKLEHRTVAWRPERPHN
ncbi:MAG: ABC transporter permease [Deltaproteobacteria bacterium]|jgi:NitT/TauT family transport system permease protein|nr:ABC transporter permease [Deltaproteobacteria bacterium]